MGVWSDFRGLVPRAGPVTLTPRGQGEGRCEGGVVGGDSGGLERLRGR